MTLKYEKSIEIGIKRGKCYFVTIYTNRSYTLSEATAKKYPKFKWKITQEYHAKIKGID